MVKKVTAAVLILIIISAIYNLGKQIASALTAGGQLDQSVEELSVLQQKNMQLKDKLAKVSQYSFIEQTARNDLGMSKEGETVIVIPQSQIDNILGSEKEVREVTLPNWQGWLNLIFH